MSFARTVASLDDDSLSSILELLDGCSLGCLLISGDSALRIRMARLVRTFKHVYSQRHRQAWPSLVSTFSGLEYLHLEIKRDTDTATIHSVDLLSLPRTLKSLKLLCANGLLELLELPPAGYTNDYFKACFRLDLLSHFTNLVELEWRNGYVADMRYWNFTSFLYTLFTWPTTLLVPGIRLEELNYDWKMAAAMPPNLRALQIRVSDHQAPLFASTSTMRLPPRLTSLDIKCEETIFPHGILSLIEKGDNSVLQSLSIDWNVRARRAPPTPNTTDLAPLAFFKSLTSLTLKVAMYDGSFVQHLPCTLISLNVFTQTLQLESLAIPFPSLLTSLQLNWSNFRSFESPISIRRGPDAERFIAVLPSMREEFVLKLPRNLTTLSHSILRLVRPMDWDALPRGIRSSSGNVVELLPADRQYFGALPPLLDSFALGNSITPEDIESLPFMNKNSRGFCTALELDLSFDPTPSPDNLPLAMELNRNLLKALAKRIYHIEKLHLKVEPTSFHLELLNEFDSVSIHNLSYSEWSPNPPEDPPIQETLQAVPKCFEHLQTLSIDEPPYWLSPHLLSSLCSLTRLSCTGEIPLPIDDNDQPAVRPFPGSLMRHFPPNLREFTSILDMVDGSTFATLPKSLTTLGVSESPPGGWKVRDLKHLPDRMTTLRLPFPSLPCASDLDMACKSYISAKPVGSSILLQLETVHAATHHPDPGPTFESQLLHLRLARGTAPHGATPQGRPGKRRPNYHYTKAPKKPKLRDEPV